MADRYWVGTDVIRNFSISGESNPNGLFFKPDGTKMYLIGSSNDRVYEYNLSSAWNIETASYVGFRTVTDGANFTTPQGVFFKDDGTRMYVIGDSSLAGAAIQEYALSTAWSISTAVLSGGMDFGTYTEQNPTGLFFKPDGTVVYVVGNSGVVTALYLFSAWRVGASSLIYELDINSQEFDATGIFFKDDGTKMYIIGSDGDDVNEYNLSVAWDISTASYSKNFSVSAESTSPQDVFFKPDGNTLFIVGNNKVFSYDIFTAWDIGSVNTNRWDEIAAWKWSATSGGPGGASVPTTADDVFFDANSTGMVIIAAGNTGAKSINCTGFTGTITGTADITVAGSVTLDAGQTYTHTGIVTFTGTGTLTTAGKTFSAVTVNGAGITLTLGDALNTATRNVTTTLGTFDTANYAVTAGALVSNNTNVRTITLGSSTVSLSGTNTITFATVTNLSFNAGTSQINMSATSATLQGGSQTFYNVSFTSVLRGTRTITGANTFNNLTLNASATGLSQLSLADNQTVNGTFTCAGSSAVARGFVRSNTIGTARTITAAAISANNCDFRDITIAGGAAGASPTRAGDCGGNSGITFPAAKTVYRVGTNTTWEGSSSWALISGGTGSNDNFPLAQDTAVIDQSTALTGTLGFNFDYNIGSLDCSTRTTGITLSHGIFLTRYGSYILGSGVTINGTNAQTFSGRGTMVFTSAGKTVTFPVVVDAPGGTFQLGDAFSASNTITHTRGTFDANNYNLTCTTFSSSNSNTRTITMGSGLWTLSGTGTVWNTGTATNLTFNKDTADILLSNTTTSARTFEGGGLSYNKLTIGGVTGVSTLQFNGFNSFTELASTKTVAHTVRFGANQGTIGTWSITGSAGNVITVDSSVAGTRRTFNLTNVTSGIDYLSVKDIGVNQANRFYVGANSTGGGNNLNVIFTAAPNLTTGNFFMLFN